MSRTNTISATLTLTEAGYKRLTSTYALYSMIHSNIVKVLKVGDNSIVVSHTTHSRLQRMFGDNCDMHIQYLANTKNNEQQ